MKIRLTMLTTPKLTSLMLILCWTAMAQQNRRAFELETEPTALPSIGSFPGTPRKGPQNPLSPLQTLEIERQAIPDVIALRKPPSANRDSARVNTIPNWSGSFTYHGIEYNYKMVGTDPKRGSTTVIPTALIPLRFVFADGNVYDAGADFVDGQLPIQAILNSPVFQNHDYVIGGTDIGNTQYGDAFQRANFWREVSHGSRNYHVLLNTPEVLSTQTINVPFGKFTYIIDPDTNQVFPVVSSSYLDNHLQGLITTLNVSPQSLPIFVTGVVSEFEGWGYHSSLPNGSNEVTYIVSPYLPQDSTYFGQHTPDLYILSHEIVEWMNDPLSSQPNFVPGWQFEGDTPPQCESGGSSDILEVGDPLVFSDSSIVPIATNSFTYHVTDAAFLGFFTRTTASRSVNGQYTFFASVTQPTPPCVAHLEIESSHFEFPDATLTTGNGINNRGQIVGIYRDASNRTHGFILDRGLFTSLDFPGSIGTFAQKISDSGQTVGYYIDATTRRPHGFLYRSGEYAQIDFPGAVATVLEGINSAGDIVGAYVDSSFKSHSFIRRHNNFQSFDSPFAQQSQANAINDEGMIAGANWNNATTGPITSFLLEESDYSPFVMPGSRNTFVSSINNHEDLTGYFLNSNGWNGGLITLFDYPYQIYPKAGGRVFGNNEKNQIVGQVFDFDVHRYVGFVSDLPKRND